MCLKLNEKHLEIAKILVEKIKNEQTISYSELSAKVGIILGKNSELYHYIWDLSYYSFDNEMPLISAIVVRKEENMPGEGFYGVYEDKRDIKVNKNKHIEVFIEELNRVMKYDNWDRLIELLEEEILQRPKLIRVKKRPFRLLHKVEEEVGFIEFDEFQDIEDIEIEEGEYIQRIINSKKRNSNARKRKLEQFSKENNGKVFCEVCKENDIVVLDVHHNEISVYDMEEGHKTKLSDLRIICSNCHRKIHGYKITVEELIRQYRDAPK